MPRFHSWTVGSCIFGAKTVIGGALDLVCACGGKNVEGLTVDAGNSVGKPPATVLFTSGEFRHPLVMVVNGNVVVQDWTNPGVLPAAAVTWNDEIVSKAMP